ncbi:formyltetrahydrofolate deformylase [Arthrobacter psychrochitiniphilus]|uniref:formyltetrahydrofolate deformylase n=1 Tax=Arthrobacter psychrochitiniphilus TaxID=291045 RepID=UPI0011B48233
MEREADIIDNLQFSDRRHLDQGAVGASGHQGEPKGHFFMRPHGAKRRVLIMVSTFEHCPNDLLFRTQTGELPVDIVAVVSNHLDHERLAQWHGIQFFHVPISAATKPATEARLLELVNELDVELVVLARYMQVLSDVLTRKLDGRATAHYVNIELDEGPIISQQIVEVDHIFGPDDLVAAGRDTECKALSNAVQGHCEGRVILHGNRTVVLR